MYSGKDSHRDQAFEVCIHSAFYTTGFYVVIKDLIAIRRLRSSRDSVLFHRVIWW